MIEHRPRGIDDPYRRQGTERFPRDPVAGEGVQVLFRASPDAQDAWLSLCRADASEGSGRTYRAIRLGTETWSADLPGLPPGAHAYSVHVQTPSRVTESPSYPLDVDRWRCVDRLDYVEESPHGLRLHLAGPEGARAVAELTFPGPGVCSCDTRLGATESEGAPPSRPQRACRVERDGDHWTVHAEGIAVRLDPATLEMHVRCPADPTLRVRAPMGLRWRETPEGGCRGLEAVVPLDDEDRLYGLGERFTEAGLRGHVWDVRVFEEYKEQRDRTYLPVPLVVSQRGWGVYLEDDAPSTVDARGKEVRWTVEADPDRQARLRRHWIVADDAYGVTAAYVDLTGPMRVPPAWSFGPWMSANTWNDQATAEAVVRRTLDEGVPATVLVLEAWSDESTFYVFNDATYEPVAGGARLRAADFRFGGRWPDPKGFIDACHARGIRVLLWQIPVQKRLEGAHVQHDADEAHMLTEGYAIRHADGRPYRNEGPWFHDALVLDVTNPDALAWWFDKRRYLFEDLGIDGMKTDGGEHLWGRDLRSHDGSTGTELVNRYPQAYVEAYGRFVREATSGDGLTFSRAGYSGAHRSPPHWAGDEDSTWTAFAASIQAGLSAGLAGVSFWGWDIAGFSGEVPTAELYVRATQMACFCPIMQYHSELHDATECRDRSPWNVAERTGDPRALSVYRTYAHLRMRLLDYLKGEAEAAAAERRPLMRYPALVWPERHDDLVGDAATYLFGRDLLVSPVLEKGAETRVVTLPPGPWVDLWTGAEFDGDRRVLMPAPFERIPVFARADSPRLGGLRRAVGGVEDA